MTLLTRLVATLRGLFRSRRQEQELDEELRAYLDIAADQKLRDDPSLTRDAAERAARLQLGPAAAVKDRVRDVWWESIVFSCGQDVRYALRTLRRTPTFTIIAILTLALGIGANSAIFTVVDRVLLRALPVAAPQRLVTLSEGTDTSPGSVPWTYPIWEQVRDRAGLFDGAIAWAPQQFNLARSGEVQNVDGLFVSGDYFTTLGVPMLLGRAFTAADDQRGGGADGAVAIISYGMWQRRFGGAAGAIGTPITIERVPCTIVGVTPPAFFGAEVGRAFDVAVPFGIEPLVRGAANSQLDVRRAFWLTIMLRLKPSQSIDAATVMLRGEQPRIRAGALPQGVPPSRLSEFMSEPLTLLPAAAGISSLRQRYERPLLALLVIVALVLLIACANLANLSLARATARRHDVSLRLALGASRWRLARQMLTESLLLASAGASLGLLVAAWGGRALIARVSTPRNPVSLDLAIDWRMIAFTAAAAIATTLLFGVVPALRGTRVDPIEALKGRGERHRRGFGVSSALVIVQMAISVLLIITAGLLVRTFQQLANVALGFESDRVLIVNLDLTRTRQPSFAAIATRPDYYQRLIDAVSRLPGIARASVSTVTPVSGMSTRFPVAVSGGLPLSPRDRAVRAAFLMPGWFATYGIPLRAGREINAYDTATSPPVIVVNEAFARRFFPDGDARDAGALARVLGRGVTPLPPPGSRDTPTPRTIVGVVGDAVYRSPREGVEPTVYEPLTQEPWRSPGISLSVRADNGSPAALAPGIAAALAAFDRDIAFSFRPLEDQVHASFAQERLVAALSGFFGALALLLAGLGLYGVTAYAATRRRAEIGIRIALGATRSRVIALVLRRSLVITAIGIASGLVAAASLTRYLEGMLFGLTPLDPPTFVGLSMVFAMVALVAAFLPARRATTVDPLVALRHE